MQAAVLRALRQPLDVAELELAAPRANEVLVKIAASGVCHSDLHRIHGDYPSPLPMVIGHEGSGTVEAVGAGVTSLQAGDHVVLSNAAYCGHCEFCGAGRFGMCEAPQAARATGNMLDGTSRLSEGGSRISHQSMVSSFAEYAVVPATGAIRVRKDAPLDKVSLAGCGVTTGVAAVWNDARVEPGERVAVFGCGGVGLNVVQAAAIAGAETIVAVDIRPAKLALATQFGATDCVDASRSEVVAEVKRIAPGGVHYAFEAIGDVDVVLQAMATVRAGGRTLVLGSIPARAELRIPWNPLLGRRQSVSFSGFRASRPLVDIPRIVDLYMAKKLKIDELISHRFALSEVNAAIEVLERGEATRSLVYP